MLNVRVLVPLCFHMKYRLLKHYESITKGVYSLHGYSISVKMLARNLFLNKYE